MRIGQSRAKMLQLPQHLRFIHLFRGCSYLKATAVSIRPIAGSKSAKRLLLTNNHSFYHSLMTQTRTSEQSQIKNIFKWALWSFPSTKLTIEILKLHSSVFYNNNRTNICSVVCSVCLSQLYGSFLYGYRLKFSSSVPMSKHPWAGHWTPSYSSAWNSSYTIIGVSRVFLWASQK